MTTLPSKLNTERPLRTICEDLAEIRDFGGLQAQLYGGLLRLDLGEQSVDEQGTMVNTFHCVHPLCWFTFPSLL